jgi:hypothetical protein
MGGKAERKVEFASVRYNGNMEVGEKKWGTWMVMMKRVVEWSWCGYVVLRMQRVELREGRYVRLR